MSFQSLTSSTNIGNTDQDDQIGPSQTASIASNSTPFQESNLSIVNPSSITSSIENDQLASSMDVSKTDPIHTRDIASSPCCHHTSIINHDPTESICKICRLYDESQPLYHPCKCSGSIQYVHQQCLLDWIQHSHTDRCELCKHIYHLTPIYSPMVPRFLGIGTILKGLYDLLHQFLLRSFRYLSLLFIWGIIFPFILSYIWNYYFNYKSLSNLSVDTISQLQFQHLFFLFQGYLIFTSKFIFHLFFMNLIYRVQTYQEYRRLRQVRRRRTQQQQQHMKNTVLKMNTGETIITGSTQDELIPIQNLPPSLSLNNEERDRSESPLKLFDLSDSIEKKQDKDQILSSLSHKVHKMSNDINKDNNHQHEVSIGDERQTQWQEVEGEGEDWSISSSSNHDLTLLENKTNIVNDNHELGLIIHDQTSNRSDLSNISDQINNDPDEHGEEEEEDDDDESYQDWIGNLLGALQRDPLLEELNQENALLEDQDNFQQLIGLRGSILLIVPHMLLVSMYIALILGLCLLIPHVIGRLCFIFAKLMLTNLPILINKGSYSIWTLIITYAPQQASILSNNINAISTHPITPLWHSFFSIKLQSSWSSFEQFFKSYPIFLGYSLLIWLLLVTSHRRSSITLIVRTIRFFVFEFGLCPWLIGRFIQPFLLSYITLTFDDFFSQSNHTFDLDFGFDPQMMINYLSSIYFGPVIKWFIGMLSMLITAKLLRLICNQLRPRLIWFLHFNDDPGFSFLGYIDKTTLFQQFIRMIKALAFYMIVGLILIWLPINMIQLISNKLPLHLRLYHVIFFNQLQYGFALVIISLGLRIIHLEAIGTWIIAQSCKNLAKVFQMEEYLLGHAHLAIIRTDQVDSTKDIANQMNSIKDTTNRIDTTPPKPSFLPIRLFFILVVGFFWLSTIISLSIYVPLVLGTWLVQKMIQYPFENDLYHLFVGIYIILITIKLITMLYQFTSKNLKNQGILITSTPITEYHQHNGDGKGVNRKETTHFKGVGNNIIPLLFYLYRFSILLLLGLGLLPYLFGRFLSLSLIIAFWRHMELPYINSHLLQYFLGILIVHSIYYWPQVRLLQRFRDKINQLQREGLTHAHFIHTMQTFIIPILFILITLLWSPILLVQILSFIHGLFKNSMLIQDQEIEVLYTIEFILISMTLVIHFTAHALKYLYLMIKDKHYLVGRQIHNFHDHPRTGHDIKQA